MKPVALLLLSLFGVIFAQNSSEDDGLKKCPGGYCVELHLCVNNSIVSDGGGIIEFGERSFIDEPIEVSANKAENADACETFLYRCCPHEGDEPVIEASTDNPLIDADILAPPPSCGRGHPNGYMYRVKEKSNAQYGEYPWMAGLFRRSTSNDLEYFCGGSLIHEQVVLTAAHCLKNFTTPNGLTVRLGEWDIANPNEPHKHKDFTVRKMIKHEGWNPKTYHNDLALLILDKPATLTKTINLICLPTQDDSFDNERCVAVGWGKDVKKGTYAEVLKKVELPVIEHRACQKMLRKTALGPLFQLNTGFLCAGGEAGVDTCKGDGGAPLMCDRGDGSYVQAGIVAWGMGCGLKDVPGVYVRVPKYAEWIERNIKQERLN